LVTTDSHGNNVTITSNDEKANVLGNYFSQIFTKETKDIYDTSKIIDRQSSPNPVNFYFDTDNILDKLTHFHVNVGFIDDDRILAVTSNICCNIATGTCPTKYY